MELRCINCGHTETACKIYGDGYKCSHIFEVVKTDNDLDDSNDSQKEDKKIDKQKRCKRNIRDNY